MIFHYSIVQVHFIFLLIEFHCTFSINYKILPYYVYYYCIFIRLGLLSFVPDFPLSILKPFFLPSLPVSLSYFIFPVPMRECLEKHSCMSSPFPIVILNGTFFFAKRHDRNGQTVACQKLTIIIIIIFEKHTITKSIQK